MAPDAFETFSDKAPSPVMTDPIVAGNAPEVVMFPPAPLSWMPRLDAKVNAAVRLSDSLPPLNTNLPGVSAAGTAPSGEDAAPLAPSVAMESVPPFSVVMPL